MGSAVAELSVKPTIYQHSGSTSLLGQLTSSRLMSCCGDTDSCPGLIYSDIRQVSAWTVLKELEEAAVLQETDMKERCEKLSRQRDMEEKVRLWCRMNPKLESIEITIIYS